MLEESYWESTLRWNLYRRWKRKPRAIRVAERMFHEVMRSVPDKRLFVDCGANFGDVTAAALRAGMQKVIAFEPDLEALAKLRARFDQDPRVTIIPKAVGDSNRTAEFHQHPEVAAGQPMFTQGSSFFPYEGKEMLTRTVEVIDIVAFLRDLPEPPTVLKMDIEGAEAECLEALLDAGMVKDISSVIVETHERLSPELAERIGRIRERVKAERLSNVNLDWL